MSGFDNNNLQGVFMRLLKPSFLFLPFLALSVSALPTSAQALSMAFSSIDFPSSTQTHAHAINNSGLIVGQYIVGGVEHGFTRSGNGVYSSYDAPVGNLAATTLSGVNSNGEIVGYYKVSSGTPPTSGLWKNGAVFNPIQYPGINDTRAFGINDSEVIVGKYKDADNVEHGYTYSNGTYTNIDSLITPSGATNIKANGINNSGQIVGEFADSGGALHGFLLSGGNFTLIDVNLSGATNTSLTGINNKGWIVGSYFIGLVEHSFVDISGVFNSFDYTGSKSSSAKGLNDYGQIVGEYTDVNGVQHGYLAQVPAPATLWLFSIGLVGLVAFRKRRTE